MKNWKVDRIISIATLVVSVVALILVLKRPAPIAAPQTAKQAIANAQSFQDKLSQLDPQQTESAQPQSTEDTAQTSAMTEDSTSATPSVAAPSISSPLSSAVSASASSAPHNEVHFSSDEVSAAIAQASGALANLSPNSDIGSMPAIKDQQISFDGDVVHGQFLTNIAGKDVWVTVSGHIGEKDGYATFDPTEFKVGDLNIPVSLVNGPLQKKLAEQRDRMKLPNNVGGVKVQDGQLVLQQK